MSMYTIGMITGILAAALIMALFAKRINKIRRGPCKYDERQELVRGRGFKYGFFTLMAYNLVLGTAYMDAAPEWCDMLMQNIIGVVLAVSVFGVYCIWNDAYMSINESPSFVYFFFWGIGGLNLFSGVMNLVHGSIVEDGRLTFRGSNLMLGAIFVLFGIVFWMRNHSRNHDEELQ